MTIRSSGALPASEINTELGLSSTAQIAIGGAVPRALAVVASGPIAFSNFYGKSNGPTAKALAIGWHNTWYTTNGTTWTAGSYASGLNYVNPSQPYQWQVSYYGGGKYMAATSGSFPNTKLMSSTDGVTWASSGTSPINANFNCGAYGAGTHVFLSSQGGANMITSTDAVNWTSRTLSGASWSHMKFANGIFIATGSSTTIGKSTNGTTWSTATYSRTRGPSEYGNGMWLQLGPGAGSPNWGKAYYYTSTDNGSSWAERMGPYQQDRNGYESPGGFGGVMYGNSKWVMFSGPYQSAYSSDGINWTTFMLPVGNWNYGTYSSALGLFIVIGAAGTTTLSGTVYQNNRCVTSPDGVNWTARTLSGTTVNGLGPFSVSSV